MHCPICQHAESSVVRTDAAENGIRRRRQCTRCSHRWTTYETAVNVVEELAKLKAVLQPVAELVK